MFAAAAVGITFPLLAVIEQNEQNVLPRFAAKWHVGKGAETMPALQYLVKTGQMEFVAKMKFLEQEGEEQSVLLAIDDKKTGDHYEEKLKIGKAYVFVNVPQSITKYVQALDKTVLSVRDTITEPKYLVVGAEWGTEYIGKLTPKLKLTEHSDVSFEFGKLKTYKISYVVNNVENYFLVVEDLPLPVRGEYHDIDGNLLYSYELVGLELS